MENNENNEHISPKGTVPDEHIDYSRSHSNREFRQLNMKNQNITPEDYDGEVENRQYDTSMEGTGDEYSNTSTGYRISAMDRKENFDDPDYGATARRTSHDLYNEQGEEKEE